MMGGAPEYRRARLDRTVFRPHLALLDNVLGVFGSLGECPEGEGGVLTSV